MQSARTVTVYFTFFGEGPLKLKNSFFMSYQKNNNSQIIIISF